MTYKYGIQPFWVAHLPCSSKSEKKKEEDPSWLGLVAFLWVNYVPTSLLLLYPPWILLSNCRNAQGLEKWLGRGGGGRDGGWISSLEESETLKEKYLCCVFWYSQSSLCFTICYNTAHPTNPTWVPNQQHTLNKLPTELRCGNFVNKHRLSMQTGAKRCESVYATCMYSN